ncbi:[4Fe-4S] proteins maturation [Elasticomyces elasticus]|nr:[4Fe-4S] proteins maturation [Elasticomyces elasticus]
MTKRDQLLYLRSPTYNNHIAMALRTIVPTCERAITRCTAPIRVRSSAVQRRSLHTSPPLFLDFLAPSWRSQPGYPSAQSLSRTPTTRLQQQRAFSSAPRYFAKAITNPRQDDDGNEMLITISPRAAHRLQAISEKDANPDLALRVSVESGGCHGFQYLMSLVNAKEVDAAEDTLFEDENSVKGDYKAKVVMDEPSLELLKGSSIDYTMELIGSQFKVTGIPGAKSSCGCGTSFDIA